jgi:2,3-dihydroxy-p-cumate/2,3-dihydroxybenzoate 3,4-dioxygenase
MPHNNEEKLAQFKKDGLRYKKLGYVALNVTDVGRARTFYENQIGLQYSSTGELGEVFLRCSTDHHNMILYPAKEPGLKRIGVEMMDDDALENIGQHLTDHAQRVIDVDPAECKALHQGRSLRFAEPFTGTTYEFYSNMYEWIGSPYVPTVCKIQRIGHVVMKTAKFAEACEFYQKVLACRTSDKIGDLVCFMRLHPNPYHHGIGLANAPAPALHHVNFMVTEVDDIGKAIARFQKSQVAIVNGPGRHPASGSMFLYYLDPDGMTLEYSFGMEEFPEEGARKPRIFEPIPESFDYWQSFSDRRKSTIGNIEPLADTVENPASA